MVDVRGRGSRLVIAFVGGLCLVSCLTAAQKVSQKPRVGVIKQENLGDMACAPCAILNMAASGSEKMQPCVAALSGNTSEQRVRALIDKYGSKQSTTYVDKRNRYTAQHGVALQELPDMVNDFLASKSTIQVAGGFLDRNKDESSEKHLRRVWDVLRKSLDAGVPPIIELRSFVARPSGSEFKWEGLMGHFVVVVELDPVVLEGEKGFRFRFADSYTGKIETGYAHAEEIRNFSATRKFSVTPEGVEQYEWITDYPYLLVNAPSLRLLTQKEPWHARTTIVLRHAVVSKSSVPTKK
ncbi:MAG: hypothetical protein IAG10_04395 [Planctomycetaceae bacterium]|nr:hypothetical protein [Planctomycetaceae bacterium]